MTMTQDGLTGGTRRAADVSYLADTIVMFRYDEFRGPIRRAISVPTKRASAHEHTIRDLVIDEHGLHVGPALEPFEGVLSGPPVYMASRTGSKGDPASPR